MFIVNDVETGRCRNTDDNRIVDAVVVMNFLDAIYWVALLPFFPNQKMLLWRFSLFLSSSREVIGI
jgi:hypothetical protein